MENEKKSSGNFLTNICVSVCVDDKQFLQVNRLSASKIFRKAIEEIRKDESAEDYRRKIANWQELFEIARKFIDKRGLGAEFEKELGK